MSYNRRTFVKKTIAASAAIPFYHIIASPICKKAKSNYPIAFFTKSLDDFGLEFMVEALSLAGVDGMDLTVRPGGRIEPKAVADDLPKVVELGNKYNLKSEMMVTAITSVDDAYAKQVLKTAAGHGVKQYRVGPFDYDFKNGVIELLDEIKKKLTLLAQLNEEVGIKGGFQNHSGTRVGSPVWDVWYMIKNLSPDLISSQFDIRHAVTEGSSSWQIALHLLSKNIGSLAIKDFTWHVSGGKANLVSVPLGEGIIDFDLYFKTLKHLNIVAPITLHAEYPLLTKEDESLSLMQKQRVIVPKLKKDVDFIRANLVRHQLV